MSIQGAINLEDQWLLFGTCIFLYTLAYSAKQCSNLRGGISIIGGFLRRLMPFGVEAGIQALAVSSGTVLNGDVHEWLSGDLSWVIDSHATCASAVDELFKELKRAHLKSNKQFYRVFIVLVSF